MRLTGSFSCARLDLTFFSSEKILSCIFDIVLVSVFCVFLEYLLVGCWTS